MATPAWDGLIEQLHAPDPKQRCRAVRQLAATRDPAVIPFLRNVYLKEEDERVLQAARDALAAFRRMETGRRRALPFSDAALRRALMILSVLFVLSLLANGALMAVRARQDRDEEIVSGTPTARDALTGALTARIDAAWQDIKNLRAEIGRHNETDEVLCTATYSRPEPYPLAAIDRETYPDLAPIADGLNQALAELQTPQATWDQICAQNVASLTSGLEALKQVDHVARTLGEVEPALERAVRDPMPTTGPSPTPSPTVTATPGAIASLAPQTATSAAPAAAPTVAPPSATPLPTHTPAPSPTPSDTPTPTETPLPFPALDYPAVLRELSARLIVLGDLQNSLGTGMINRWQQAQAGEPASASFCTFSAWPSHFFWTDAQRAELARPDVADPDLEEAVRLLNEGLDRALAARNLFEPSCQSQTLATTASGGIALAQEAFDMISEAQGLLEKIRRRR